MDFSKMKKELADSEAKLMEKLKKSLSNREAANKQCREMASAARESDDQADADMEALRRELQPYLDGRKKMDAEGMRKAAHYDRAVKDKRLLMRGSDMLDETVAGADLNEIGPESDGATSYAKGGEE